MLTTVMIFPRMVYHAKLGMRVCPDPEQHEVALAAGWSDSPIHRATPTPATPQTDKKLPEQAYVERDALVEKVKHLESQLVEYTLVVDQQHTRILDLQGSESTLIRAIRDESRKIDDKHEREIVDLKQRLADTTEGRDAALALLADEAAVKPRTAKKQSDGKSS